MRDIIIKAADKGDAIVVWRAYHRKQALWQLSDSSFMKKLTINSINKNIVKNAMDDRSWSYN